MLTNKSTHHHNRIDVYEYAHSELCKTSKMQR